MAPPEPLPDLVDSHCHLTWESFGGDLEAVLSRMREAGVAQAVVVGTTVEDSTTGRDLCRGREGLHPTAGIHPNEVPDDAVAAVSALRALVREGGFVGVGETGLDYYRDAVDRDRQAFAFRAQAALARELDLPVVVHLRDVAGRWDAFEDAARIVEEHPALRGVVHCFTGDAVRAQRFLDLGFHVSFSGILTFPGAHALREAARTVPLGRTLVETDAPFLAPLPHRGARNEPGFVAHTARRLAEVKGVPEAEARRTTAANARSLFRLPQSSGREG